MVDEQLFLQLLFAVVDAIRQRDWDRLILANHQLEARLTGQRLSAVQQQTLRQAYQAGLSQCQRVADDLWLKIQKTLADREAMAAYACFGDQDSFTG